MKKLLFLALSLFISASTFATGFYDFKLPAIDGKMIDFKDFKGKKVLIVNVASKCGFTPQYEDLQKLYEKYQGKLVILGFPANNFAHQEPGSNDEIASFCEEKYGVTFQMMQKISVKGADMNPLYQWLTNPAQNGWNSKGPNWNFNKYLINEKGELTDHFPSKVKPLSPEITEAIEQ